MCLQPTGSHQDEDPPYQRRHLDRHHQDTAKLDIAATASTASRAKPILRRAKQSQILAWHDEEADCARKVKITHFEVSRSAEERERLQHIQSLSAIAGHCLSLPFPLSPAATDNYR